MILEHPMQEIYCQQVCRGENAMNASLKAGYVTYATVTPAMKLRIAELLKMAANLAIDDAARVQYEMQKLAMSNMGNLYRPDGTLIPIQDLPAHVTATMKTVKIDPATQQITEIQFWDKNSALSNLARVQGLYNDKLSVTTEAIDKKPESITSEMSPEKAAELYALTLGK